MTRLLQICHICRRVRDHREKTQERWVTKNTFQESTGIDPRDWRLIHTYCPMCDGLVHNYLKAA
jgi:hypothetical protein